jgi:hypothetical protein
LEFRVHDEKTQKLALVWEGYASVRSDWHHIAITRESGIVNMYVDGIARETGYYAGNVGDNSHDLWMGRNPDNPIWDALFGQLDEVAIWDRALTPGEINNHYVNGLVGDSYVNLPMMAVQDLFNELGDLDLPAGTENSLLSKLDAALNCLDNGNDNAAMNILDAFKNSIEAQRGKKITSEQADMLIETADDILATI